MFFDADRFIDLDLSSNGKATILWHLTRTGIWITKLIADFVSKAINLIFIARCLFIYIALILFQMHCKIPFINLISTFSRSIREFCSFTLLYMYDSYTLSCRFIVCILFDLPVHYTRSISDKIYIPLLTCPIIYYTVVLVWLIILLTALSIFHLPNCVLEYNMPVFVTKRYYFTPDYLLSENISQFTCFTVRPYCRFWTSLFRPGYNVFNILCCTFAQFSYRLLGDFLYNCLYIWSFLITCLFVAFYFCVCWRIWPLNGFILLFFRPLFGFELLCFRPFYIYDLIQLLSCCVFWFFRLLFFCHFVSWMHCDFYIQSLCLFACLFSRLHYI